MKEKIELRTPEEFRDMSDDETSLLTGKGFISIEPTGVPEVRIVTITVTQDERLFTKDIYKATQKQFFNENGEFVWSQTISRSQGTELTGLSKGLIAGGIILGATGIAAACGAFDSN